MDDVKTDDVSVVREFIARINAADVEGLGRLMAPDHSLEVFDEAPFVGRDENIEAWHGYAGSWPSYHIYEDATGRRGEWVAVLGHTTGSHLELPDEEEEQLTLIWVADVVGGLVHTWRLEPDTIERRAWYGITA
jgi:SnoaL-like domain